MVVDQLHLFPRISDRLELILLAELLDCIPRGAKLSRGFDLHQIPNIAKVVNFIRYLGIPFAVKVVKTTKLYSLAPELKDPNKLKLIKSIPIPMLFPTHPTSVKIQQLWKDFFSIVQDLKQHTVENEFCDRLAMRTKVWLRSFAILYWSGDVTPRMHIKANHIPDFIRLHGSLALFSQQGQEKFNDVLSGWNFRSTCYHRSQVVDAYVTETEPSRSTAQISEAKSEQNVSCCHEPSARKFSFVPLSNSLHYGAVRSGIEEDFGLESCRYDTQKGVICKDHTLTSFS